jgi:TrmH family RNA methyltransferase
MKPSLEADASPNDEVGLRVPRYNARNETRQVHVRFSSNPSTVDPRRAVKHIASRDNPQFRQLWRLAHSARERRGGGQMLLDGVHLIDAYAAVFGPGNVQLFARASSLDREEVAGRLRLARDPVVLSDALFDEISPVETPTGVLAVAPIPQPGSVAEADRDRFSVFLDGLQDPGNLGAVLRSAAAAGGRDAFLSAQCADPWSPKCLRGAMGAHFHLVLHDRVDLLDAARSFGGRLIAADSRGERNLFEADLEGTVGFIIGGEGTGISPALFELAAERIRIPMAAGIESLNAAAAATLVFYEWRRRRSESNDLRQGGGVPRKPRSKRAPNP